jgi:uncharacterized protein YoxC
MIFQPTDVALFLISFAACIYCIVLSRRLAKLQDTKDGLGATIKACTESISSMALATRSTTMQAKELAANLSHLLERSEAASQKMELHILQMEKKHKEAVHKIEAAQSEAEGIMSEVLTRHKKHVSEVINILKQPDKATAQLPAENAQQAKFRRLLEQTKRREGIL